MPLKARQFLYSSKDEAFAFAQGIEWAGSDRLEVKKIFQEGRHWIVEVKERIDDLHELRIGSLEDLPMHGV